MATEVVDIRQHLLGLNQKFEGIGSGGPRSLQKILERATAVTDISEEQRKKRKSAIGSESAFEYKLPDTLAGIIGTGDSIVLSTWEIGQGSGVNSVQLEVRNPAKPKSLFSVTWFNTGNTFTTTIGITADSDDVDETRAQVSLRFTGPNSYADIDDQAQPRKHREVEMSSVNREGLQLTGVGGLITASRFDINLITNQVAFALTNYPPLGNNVRNVYLPLRLGLKSSK